MNGMKHDGDKLKILFVCTGNACRSQMAEAWARELKRDILDPYSAGTHPAGKVSSRVIHVMDEVGVDMSDHWSKPIEQWQGIDFDYVITLCDRAREFCPAFSAPTRMIYQPFPDPMALIGDEAMTRDAFRRARDMIKEYVLSLPEALEK